MPTRRCNVTDDIREILQRADQPRSPTPAELERIHGAVFGPSEISRVESEQQSPADIGLSILQPESLQRERAVTSRTRRLVPLAAVLVIIAGLIVAYAVRDQPDSVVTAPPVPAACANQVPELVAALNEWRSIETWAMVGASEPDLGRRLVAVLDELDTTAADAIADELRAVLDESADSPGQFVEERSTTARRGFEEVVAELTPFGDDCQVSALRAALG